MLLNKKVAIVTGASRGIGKIIAVTFAREGAHVILNYVKNEEKATQVISEIEEFGGSAHLVQADISREGDVKRLIDFAIKEYDQIDVLVNNAGVTRDGLFIHMSEEDWDFVMNTNLKGTFLCCKYALRKMIRQRSGKIINLSSISGLLGNAGQCNYAASKAGIIGLTKSIAQEYSHKGITANVISPGVIDTEMSNQVPDKVKQSKVDQTLLGRPGTPSEIAETALFLASRGTFVNGEVIRVDGGMRF